MGMFTDLVGQKVFDFNTPVNNELSILAKSHGDELLGFGIREYAPERACDYRNFDFSCGHNQDVRVVHYRKGGYRCQQCLTENFHSVARSRGLTLVSMDIVKYGNDREYLRPCGHTEIHSHNYLLKHAPEECQSCILSEVLSNIEKHEFSFIAKVPSGYLLECNSCQTRATYSTTIARGNKPNCKPCFEKLLTQEAEVAGFTYLMDKPVIRHRCESRTTLNRWYSCNNCRHVDSYSHGAMRLRNVKCDSCFTKQKIEEASTQGMQYLGHFEKGEHLYMLPCGCQRLYTLHTIRKGVWACKVHGDTHYHRVSGLYLLELETADFTWLKFGYAKNLDIRLKGYGLPEDCKSDVLFYQDTATGYDAIRLEKQIHREMGEFKIDSSLMKKYMTNTGHTECYPISAKQLLLDKLYSVSVNNQKGVDT